MKTLKLILSIFIIAVLLISSISCEVTIGDGETNDGNSESTTSAEDSGKTKKEYVQGDPRWTPTKSNSLLVELGMTYTEAYVIMGNAKYGVGSDLVYVWDLVEGGNFIVWCEVDENRQRVIVKKELDPTGTKMEITATPKKENINQIKYGMSYREVLNLFGYDLGLGKFEDVCFIWELDTGEIMEIVFDGTPGADAAYVWEAYVGEVRIHPDGYYGETEYYVVEIS